MQQKVDSRPAWFDRPIIGNITLRWETVLIAFIFILAVFTRFYDLDTRVMSHDETIHVYHNAWSLYTGQGYRHDPLSHGPFQTHIVALAYFLLGDSDFSARVPAVLFSIATVLFVWNYRRYIGRAGALIAAAMMLISPYLLFYGRYVRNEAYAAFAGVVLLWAILRYLETGKAKYTYWVTLATVLHFSAKETAFIYTAQALLFLGFYFVFRVTQAPWQNRKMRDGFLLSLIIAVLGFGAAGMIGIINRNAAALSATQTAAPPVPGQALEAAAQTGLSSYLMIPVLVGVLALIVAVVFLVSGYTWKKLKVDRSFGLLVILGTLVFPHLSAFPVRFVGWKIPINANEVLSLTMTDIYHIAAFLIPMSLIAIAIGLLWNAKLWLINAAIFYAFFTIFYTTVFTNGAGFFTGLVGSLGYWLAQQKVARGSQPWYYYLAVQIPVYEYLAALASMLGFGILITRAVNKWLRPPLPQEPTDSTEGNEVSESLPSDSDQRIENPPVLGLLSFWVITSVLAYSIAGEKMPWLTVHMTWPMVLFGGWGIGYIVDRIDWSFIKRHQGWLILILIPIFLVSFASALRDLFGAAQPFQGKDLDQLQQTSNFMLSFIVAIASGIGLIKLTRRWPIFQLLGVITVFFFGFLGLLTMRTAALASYINMDTAKEFLVYAHSARGVKEVMAQVEDISRRTSDGLNLPVAFDGEYPFWWYLRNYKDTRFFGANPTRSLRDVPIIIVGEGNFGKIEPIVGDAYEKFEYIRLWWPNQDYFNLTWDRIRGALKNPQMREALFQIWLNRDYKLYGQLTTKDMSLENWSPSQRMRLYIRKDIASKIWEYGVSASAAPVVADPYEGKQVNVLADKVFGTAGNQEGQFQKPRDLAVAPDGSLYVADTENNRIQHISVDGQPLKVWGSFADASKGEAPGGTFFQPWGIAVAQDGSVFVADTWNHRIQKFSKDGEFIKMWGYFGQAEKPEAFWGPRDIAIDAQGRLYVVDTGNKRIVLFDQDGNYLTQFGSEGFDPGQFSEPVGITVDNQGVVYIADTWNQRIQSLKETNGVFTPENSWDVAAWYGQSLDNKPYLTVDNKGNLYATDPEGYRVLQFNTKGQFLQYWGDFGVENNQFGMAGSVATDSQGGVWVTDTGNGRLMLFHPPAPANKIPEGEVPQP